MGIPYNPADVAQLGRMKANLQGQIDDLAQQNTNTALGSGAADFPVIDGTFTPVFNPAKKAGRVRVTLRFAGFGNADDIKTVFVYRDDIVTSTDYDQKRQAVKLADKIDNNGKQAQQWVTQLDVNLLYGRTVDIIALVSIGSDGANRARNPPTDPLFSGYPGNILYTFNTPQAFGAPSAPSSGNIIYNELDPTTPDIYDAHVGLRVYAPLTAGGLGQSFQAAGVDWVQVALTRSYPSGTERSPFQRILNDTELTQVDAGSTPANQGFVVINCPKIVPGGSYLWVENLVHANGQKNSATGSVAIVGANLALDVTAMTNKAVTVSSTDPFDGKHVKVNLEFTQTTPNPTALRNYTVKLKKSTDTDWTNVVDKGNIVQSDAYHQTHNDGTLSISSGTKNVTGVGTKFKQRLQEGWKWINGAQTFTAGTITDDTHMTTTANAGSSISGGAYSVVCVVPVVPSMKVKPSTTYNLLITLRARGVAGVSTVDLTATFTTDADGNVVMDTAVPTLATNPDTGTTGPTVRERHSQIKATAPLPSANVATLDQFQFVLSTQNTAPAGTPTVGSEGVLAISYGQTVVFPVALTTALTTDFYLYYRAHNGFSTGYSVWSAGTNQHGYSRPIQDWIGTGVPVLPIRLESNGTAPGSPAIANDTTHYSIDTADTEDYQALITAGITIHLHIPSLAANNRVRKATAYDTTNHRFTVNVAFGSTPGNSLAYEIHRGLELGEKSGTASGSTSTVVLGADASSVDSTYNGMSVYLPASAAADQIRRITGYVGATKTATLESVLSSAISTGDCYAISKGSFGYAAINPLSGIIAGVPFRVWYNSDTVQNVLEAIMPTGENAFSVQAIQILGYRKSNGVQRSAFKGNVTVSPTYPQIAPPGFTPIWRLRLQNLFRDGGSDGWSSYSYYSEGYTSGVTSNYDPATYTPVEIDYQGVSSYPDQRYPTY